MTDRNDKDYQALRTVLDAAYDQAAIGKGRDRHAQDLPFEQQPMQRLLDLYGPGFAAGQIGKKVQESLRLPTDMAVQELLGAIVYAAGLIVWLRETRADREVHLAPGTVVHLDGEDADIDEATAKAAAAEAERRYRADLKNMQFVRPSGRL
jgi:hypothetical protein